MAGGIQVEGLGSTDIDNQAELKNSPSIGGLGLELHQRLSKYYGRLDELEDVLANGLKRPEVWKFESCVAEKVIKDWLDEYPALTIIKSWLVEDEDAVQKEGNIVTSCKLANGQVIYAKYFIEASYEGDFLPLAGISTIIGRERSSTYNESLAGIRADTKYTQFDVPVDPYIITGDPSSGLIFGISPEPFGEPGSGDEHLAGYSYRLPLTDVESNKLPLYKPLGYDPAHYELHRRYLRAGGKLYTPRLKGIPKNKTDLIGSEAVLATDLLGMNDDWPKASSQERQRILEETATFTKGLIWFFANDESVPADMRNEWSRFGYCLNEFPDNNHFPRQLYIRDARRMLSDYVITQHTATDRDHGGDEEDPYPVAIAYWPTDTHCARRIVRNGLAHNEGFVFKEKHHWRPFGISYRALVPKRNEAVNVLTATCPSSSHVGYGAVRIEHQFYELGQACANACDIALARGNLAVQDVPYDVLREQLLKQGAVLDVGLVGKPDFSVLGF
ncbi:Hypothetical protein PENO1_002460 [Penicillium occitanis (nom. inval.)]|nr:hypothetical protein PENOC_016360 [Penicillium occitanis (nom. inval.)]PCH09200.1 Hypothetical protein PENO1_002460 [Penicillium occitanis (nom. inval.)]